MYHSFAPNCSCIEPSEFLVFPDRQRHATLILHDPIVKPDNCQRGHSRRAQKTSHDLSREHGRRFTRRAVRCHSATALLSPHAAPHDPARCRLPTPREHVSKPNSFHGLLHIGTVECPNRLHKLYYVGRTSSECNSLCTALRTSIPRTLSKIPWCPASTISEASISSSKTSTTQNFAHEAYHFHHLMPSSRTGEPPVLRSSAAIVGQSVQSLFGSARVTNTFEDKFQRL